MEIIPALDIMDKKVVRLQQGEFNKERTYSENPILVAKEWKEQGAQRLHVVDLDGARLGKPVNMDVVSYMIRSVNIDVELGGGLRRYQDVEAAFKIGARFAIVGTRAVSDEAFCRKLIDSFGDRIIFAVDAKDGKVAIKGWKEVSENTIVEYIKNLESMGAKKVIYTDISRDGMMSGPNLETLKEVLESSSLDVMVSGGISDIRDIKVMKGLEKYGLKGIVIGMALYEGRLDLKKAITCVSEPLSDTEKSDTE
ncbi:MAG: 1-(5-phosphoribosyl)-5-[(5-phosphoribosylamino)methylideneamino]imidazole-4-carboxamide isomerase [Candidatus Omnitrophica bacterium]|nr:1-(5-phosphoribosyl)-5-[(5-phosphoribosylamino)methylideneamino]imidazole-4-carboxamide isomerase [Candidatus Omnitrophota bacterium]